MAASDKALKLTPGGMPGPQSHDNALADWVLSTGHNGAGDVYVVNQPISQAATVVDGGDVTQGAKADVAVVDPSLSASEIALLKGLVTILKGTLAVSGTVNVGNFPATQPVSGTVGVNALPALPVGGNNIGDVDVLTLPPVTGTVTANIGTTGALALDGTDTTGVTPPAGATGVRGWLSGLFAGIGSPSDAAATTDTGTFSLISLFKRLLSRFQNTEGTLLPSAARTTTGVSPTQPNLNASGVTLFLDVTVASGTGGLRVIIQILDPASGKWVRYNADPTVVTTTGTYCYVLCSGAASGAVGTAVRQTVSAPLLKTWRVVVEPGDATSYTYSLGHSLNV